MRVAIIGCGTVGASWAVCFVRAGHSVSLYDLRDGAAERAKITALESLRTLKANGVRRVTVEADAMMVVCETLAQAMGGVNYAQESITEEVGAKAGLFEQMDALADEMTILASSTSAILPTSMFERIAGRERCLVAHPFNPPHLVPLVEVVGSTWTRPDVVDATMRIMTAAGQAPILVRKEIQGFVGNRLQAAVVNEAMNLVRLGVVSPSDLDRCMTAGLGRRWVRYGPFETMDLNASEGFAEYSRKFGESYQELGTTLGVDEKWSADTAATVELWRRSVVPLDALADAQMVRDLFLLKLGKWLGLDTSELATIDFL